MVNQKLLNFGAELFYYSGLFNFIKWWNKNKVKIIMYHRVDDNNLEILAPYSSLAVSLNNFENQMRFLKKNYNVISFKDLYNPPPNSIIITFDDGYLDNYTKAYPILKKYNLSATIFVVTDSIDGKLNWLNKFYYCLNKVKFSDFVQKFYEIIGQNVKVKNFVNTCEDMQDYLMYNLSKIEREVVVDKLLNSFSLKPKQKYYVNWKQLNEMNSLVGDLITVGAHTCSHPILSKLSSDELKEELVNSKKRIEEMVGDVEVFAYPWGHKKVLNKQVVREVSKHYRYAVTTLSNLSFKNKLLLPRIGVPNKNQYIFGLYLELVNVIKRFRK